MQIRSATPEDRDSLTALAIRSKAFWPYDKATLEEYRSALEVPLEDILADSVHVITESGQIIGFYGLSSEPNSERLYFLFVEPTYIGKGYGKALWTHAVWKARSRGWRSLSFFADTHAVEAFYRHQNCRVIGSLSGKLGPLTEMRCEF